MIAMSAMHFTKWTSVMDGQAKNRFNLNPEVLFDAVKIMPVQALGEE
jgi:hypothetical protein